MTRAVYALGAAMVVLGLVFISMGVPLVRLEIGWTEIIGGAVAASAGCVVLVLGVFLTRLEAMQRVLERLVVPPAGADAAAPTVTEIVDPVRVETPAFPDAHPLAPPPQGRRPAPGFVVLPEPALSASLHVEEPGEEAPVVDGTGAPTLPESAPALLAEEEQALQSPDVPSVDTVAEPVKARTSFLSSILARRGAAGSDRRRPAPPATSVPEPSLVTPPEILSTPLRTSIDLSSGWDSDEPDVFAKRPREAAQPPADADPIEAGRDPEVALHAVPEATREPEPEPVEDAPEPAPEPVVSEQEPVIADPPPVIHALPPKSEPHPLQPVVVGRYNAGSASYVMYSNGMIEVETEQGTHQFASMQELKAFIERRDARVS